MNFWIVKYHHRHGTDVWPLFQDKRPSQSEMIKGLPDWEPDQGEWLEAVGESEKEPWVTEDEAYSGGWDTHEGSLLDILGITDAECNGIDNVIIDLVKRCRGFKAWRSRYVHHHGK